MEGIQNDGTQPQQQPAQPVDYTALAKQHGAISSQPSQPTAIDYTALAKQHGAVSSTPTSKPATEPASTTQASAARTPPATYHHYNPLTNQYKTRQEKTPAQRNPLILPFQ